LLGHPGVIKRVRIIPGHGVEELAVLGIGYLVFSNPVFIGNLSEAGRIGGVLRVPYGYRLGAISQERGR
jgi:hypothetical protein